MAEVLGELAWDDLRLILAVAQAGGLPSAADRTGLDHSTVFRRLRRIERDLGMVLFERHRSGFAATAAGLEVVALATRLNEDINTVSRRLAGLGSSPRGEVRVTTNDSLLVYLLTPMFATFRRACPDVRLDLVLSNQALNLSRRDADIAVRASDDPPENLVGRRVARIAWALYGRVADFSSRDRGAGLAQRDWVVPGDELASLRAIRQVREKAPKERLVYQVNTVLGLAHAVEAGIGIGHLPCFVADTMPALVRLADPDPALAADLWVLTHPDIRNAPRIRVLMDFLATEIGRRRGLIEACEPG